MRRLLERSFAEAWSFEEDLPWRTRVDPLRPGTGLQSLLEDYAPVRRMTARRRAELAFAESVHHLSNLLAGERSGERLAAQVIAAGSSDVEILSVIAHDEARHYLALHRYLDEKAGRVERTDAALSEVIEALEERASPEAKLLVGQVILEWTAAALLATLVARVREPLLRAILRYNLRDESRHIAYGTLLRPELARSFAAARPRREMEDLAYEAVRASARALLAAPVWRRFGLSPKAARAHAVSVLQQAGVIDRYTLHVPLQLERCGFPAERMRARLSRDLAPSLRADA